MYFILKIFLVAFQRGINYASATFLKKLCLFKDCWFVVNGILLYTSILKPEKYVNRHNFAENDSFEFKFGQKSDIKEVNIPDNFVEIGPRDVT